MPLRPAVWRLVARRIAHSLVVLWAVSILAFGLAELAPGDPFAPERLDPSLSEAAYERLLDRSGLNAPLAQRYGRWLLSLARGELGVSVRYRRPVAELLVPRFAATLTLTLSASLAAWALALVLGAWSARRPGGAVDRASLGLTSLLQALPELLLALLAAALAVRIGLPVSGMASLDAEHLSFPAQLLDRLRHMAAPVTVLTLAGLPPLLHHVRAALAEALASPQLLAAKARGLTRRRLFFAYALPLAANPLISLWGLSWGGLLSSSLIVEVVLGWPGAGPLMLEAVLARDLHLVLGGALAATALLLLGNALADLALATLDPRADGSKVSR
ncbi:MAG: ABC transporter permease [Acidobacteriota bacterium]